MGVLLYALLCGFLPFDDDNVAQLYKKIKVCSHFLCQIADITQRGAHCEMCVVSGTSSPENKIFFFGAHDSWDDGGRWVGWTRHV